MYATQRIYENFERLQRLEDVALWIVENGEAEDALRVGQAAGDFAWYNVTGAWHSPKLEQVAITVGSRFPNRGRPSRPQTGSDVKRVLHVLSEAHHSAGGHVRMAWRWIQQDKNREHSVAILNQPSHEGPSPTLYNVVDGRVEVLNASISTLVERAMRLREIASSFDLVVLHVHPYDMIATTALSGLANVPIIFVNHADHVFWTSASSFDVVACYRPVGQTICREQRGIASDRIGYLPLIIDDVDRSIEKNTARSQLGIPSDHKVLLTAGHSYKYIDPNDIAFIDLVLPLIRQRDDITLLVAGGGDHSSWGDINAATNGAIRLLGSVSDLRPHFAATDIYLDAYPIGSSTSVLEAACYGVPVVGLAPDELTADLLHNAGFASDNQITMTTNANDYRATINKLLDDPTKRNELGAAARSGVEAHNLADAWQSLLEDAYDQACRWQGSRSTQRDDNIEPNEVDVAILRSHDAGGMLAQYETVMMRNGLDPNALDQLSIALQQALVG